MDFALRFTVKAGEHCAQTGNALHPRAYCTLLVRSGTKLGSMC